MCNAISANAQVDDGASQPQPKAEEDVHGEAAPLEVADTTQKFNATDICLEDFGIEVRWMASGNTACLVQASANMCMSEVKAQVQAQAKVPVEEQRLFSSGQELHCEGAVPQMHASELMLVRSVSDPRATDLAHFHPSSPFESLNSSDFTMVRKLNTGINGDIFRYEWSYDQDRTSVAVKKLRNSTLQRTKGYTETDERYIHTKPQHRFTSNEDSLTEIGILLHLSRQPDLPLYLLKMHGVFAEMQFTWLVTEFAEGGELFDVAAAGGLGEKKVEEYMWQLLQAVDYLHRHQIGHRDISLENVLLKGDIVRLMDYGMAVRTHASSGTPLRYFREVGKAFYRAPECYVPTRDEVVVAVPPSARAGDVVMSPVAPGLLCEVRLPADAMPGADCKADVWGYAAVPADVFALGICMFILAFQCPAWEFAKLSNRFFAHAYNNEDGIESLLKLWGKQHVLSPQATHMMSHMLQTDPTSRPSPADCLNHEWFAATTRELERHV